jgi:hypothetical protein
MGKDWDRFISYHIDYYTKWHEKWIDLAKKKVVPITFVRFEDLLADKSA